MPISTVYPKVPLREVLTQVARPIRVEAGDSYRSLGVMWYAKGLFIKDPRKGSEIKAARLFLVEDGDFIYNRLFAWKGSFAVAGPEHIGCVVSGEFPIFRINPKKLSLMYLMAFFSSPWLWEMIAGQSSGTAEVSRLRLKEEVFLRLTIPLPSLQDQERIVKLLDEANELKKLRDQTNQRADALIPKLFHDRFGDPTTNREGWPVVTLGEVGGSGQYGLNSAAMTEGNGVRFIRITDIDEFGTLGRCGPAFVPANTPDLDQYELEEGDVLIARTGATAGKAYIHKTLDERSVFAGYLIRFKIDHARALPTYVLSFLQSAAYWTQLNNLKRGAAQPNVNAKQLASLNFLLPPLSLQREFAVRVGEIREMRTQQVASSKHLDDLFRSMLHRAFNGEL